MLPSTCDRGPFRFHHLGCNCGELERAEELAGLRVRVIAAETARASTLRDVAAWLLKMEGVCGPLSAGFAVQFLAERLANGTAEAVIARGELSPELYARVDAMKAKP